MSLAVPADAGHLDELQGEGPHGLAPTWGDFFDHTGTEGLADLNRRAEALQRQIRDNGVTYNVYADESGLQRPWALDLFPMILGPRDWAQIEAGVLQRARLLNAMMADLYGPRELLKRALLPAALVQGHPGYLRAMQGMQPRGGTWLHIVGFDLAHGPDGRWWVVGQRTQAPSGLGYLLENRIAISRQFPKAFAGMKVQRLAASYRALVNGIQAMAPEGENARIALLTPGPYNETYFEHAYLARYLGLTLVEGNDLTVRDERLFLKTLAGLEPVHALIKRVDDQWLDPLELRTDSTLGVPGLLQVLRAGNLLLANAPGSAPLESSALLGFLPAISEHLLGEPLQLPSLATWWCGEDAALRSVLPLLKDGVIKATYPQGGPQTVIGQGLGARALDEWTGRLVRQPEQYTVQSWLPLSQTPTWTGDRLMPRSAMLRVFALADGAGSWRVLPGGLVRLAPRGQLMATMQRGGSSADCWVLTEGAVDHTSLLQSQPSSFAIAQQKQPVTSRAAENLFWLGRYTERAENSVRLAEIVLDELDGEEPGTRALLSWLTEVSRENALVLADVPEAHQSPRVFARSLMANLAPHPRDPAAASSFSAGFNLRAIAGAAAQVRERLSREHWNLIERAQAGFASSAARLLHGGDFTTGEAQLLLQEASQQLAAITGSQTDRMVRDDGWRLLSIGRHIERLATLSRALALGLETGSVHEPAGFEAMVALFDSTITFHAQYQQRRDLVALIDLLVLDRDNPRSLAWVVQTLRARLARLGQSVAPQDAELARDLPDPATWQLAELSNWQRGPDGRRVWSALTRLLEDCEAAAIDLSDEITRLHFSHADRRSQTLSI
ncbi:MAG: A circularly permuted ATPgrasp family protein [Hydrogenophaga sp.]|nr:circularly permuted type 2 ATP-grasp protein [Hydrogenophaga sp.]NIM41881.1 A circularly permuted ATPgrasp family protein [Hydrogenophaga sp.]NIN27186.1 A circularly permuted ATPgrasp family protein [Hydrogenophaga sp.]NIN31887.1 A circularly permuted ATPgrasp family protein [Hydrogenophaga sp.]NIN56131.1 A circularly permuted ATPgrasp family protein [Hydrogenophaga sp.]NIO52258.1 A circularly permuted ATPgrasp family protein [Hydrogenophaga sp.]